MEKFNIDMQEIILKKVSVFKTSINDHLLKTVLPFIKTNKNKFELRSWDCNIKTSLKLYKNILYEAEEFKYLRKNIEEKIEEVLKLNNHVDKPFYIFDSWVNFYEKGGYQEFHKHDMNPSGTGSGVLYLSEKNSAIEFTIFPEDTRTKIIPEKADLLLFDTSTYHRVLDSQEKNRISLAFNFNIHG
jgi:hypothetical protein